MGSRIHICDQCKVIRTRCQFAYDPASFGECRGLFAHRWMQIRMPNGDDGIISVCDVHIGEKCTLYTKILFECNITDIDRCLSYEIPQE